MENRLFLERQDKLAYDKDGFVFVEDLFSPEEVERLIWEIEKGQKVQDFGQGVDDAGGKKTNLAIWDGIGDDVWSAVSSCPRIINNVRFLLGEETAFYHGKVMMKEAQTGGAWEWHQDYGYWYNNGFLFPRMMSVFVALDEATEKNGCLQILKASHELGRLEHQTIGQQTGIDSARIEQVEPLFEKIHCTMKPGTALFFHCNLLHASSANQSEHARRSFIMCYNALHNPRYKTAKGGSLVSENRPCPTGSDNWLEQFPLPETAT